MTQPYLRNCWYQAAFSQEVDDRPLARTFLDIPMVLYRSNGDVVALRDRCPHRFVPLSAGVVRDGAIVCGYHGLAFGAAGRCVVNPHGPITSAMRVQSFPVVERQTVVWIWMGEPESADPSLIPNLAFIEETPALARICFYIPTAANYRLIVDNLMDLSHADFLHPTSLGGVMTGVNARTAMRDGVVVAEWINIDCVAPARFQARVPSPLKADAWTEAMWRAPAVMVIGTALVPTGTVRSRSDEIWALHSMTPETATTSHYFVCGTRGERLDDADYSAQLKVMLANAFLAEDKPMLEAQQRAIGETDLSSLAPMLLRTDAGAVLVRRELDKRVAAERRLAAAPANAA